MHACGRDRLALPRHRIAEASKKVFKDSLISVSEDAALQIQSRAAAGLAFLAVLEAQERLTVSKSREWINADKPCKMRARLRPDQDLERSLHDKADRNA